jgi:hypothetical protein
VLNIGANELIDGGDEGCQSCDDLQMEADVSSGLVLTQLPLSLRLVVDVVVLRQPVGKRAKRVKIWRQQTHLGRGPQTGRSIVDRWFLCAGNRVAMPLRSISSALRRRDPSSKANTTTKQSRVWATLTESLVRKYSSTGMCSSACWPDLGCSFLLLLTLLPDMASSDIAVMADCRIATMVLKSGGSSGEG